MLQCATKYYDLNIVIIFQHFCMLSCYESLCDWFAKIMGGKHIIILHELYPSLVCVHQLISLMTKLHLPLSRVLNNLITISILVQRVHTHWDIL